MGVVLNSIAVARALTLARIVRRHFCEQQPRGGNEQIQEKGAHGGSVRFVGVHRSEDGRINGFNVVSDRYQT